MGLSEEMQNLITYSDKPKELPAFLTVSWKRDDQIHQGWGEEAAQNRGEAVGFTCASAPAPPKAPETAPAGTVAMYSRSAPMDLRPAKRRISAEERAKRFADGRCFYCGAFNHRVAECAARKKAHTFNTCRVEVKEVGTREGSEELGKK